MLTNIYKPYIILTEKHPLAIQTDGKPTEIGELTTMSIQKNITFQVHPSTMKMHSNFAAATLTEDCDINIQVANGWTITGHYCNQVLQTVTLEKTDSEGSDHNG